MSSHASPAVSGGTATNGPVAGPRVPRRGLLSSRLRALRDDDTGMSTAEYAIGTIAAAAFAAILYAVVSGDGIVGALTDIVQRALTATF